MKDWDARQCDQLGIGSEPKALSTMAIGFQRLALSFLGGLC